MKLKQIFALMAITSSFAFGFTGCDDNDYAPVILKSATETTVKIEDNTLVIDAFNQGEKYHIAGGDGHYQIQNHSEDIIDYRYDGKVLTFIPVSLGTGTITIEDFSGNRMILTIKVINHEETYCVTSLEAEAYGDRMLVGDKERLEEQIVKESLVQVGGKYVFTFTNPSQSQGSVSVYPKENSKPISAIFSKEHKFTEKGVEYEEYSIILPSKVEHKMMLMKDGNDPMNKFIFQEDVTEFYNTYSELEKAWLIQHVSF